VGGAEGGYVGGAECASFESGKGTGLSCKRGCRVGKCSGSEEEEEGRNRRARIVAATTAFEVSGRGGGEASRWAGRGDTVVDDDDVGAGGPRNDLSWS
jgi:hypothetical protein